MQALPGAHSCQPLISRPRLLASFARESIPQRSGHCGRNSRCSPAAVAEQISGATVTFLGAGNQSMEVHCPSVSAARPAFPSCCMHVHGRPQSSCLSIQVQPVWSLSPAAAAARAAPATLHTQTNKLWSRSLSFHCPVNSTSIVSVQDSYILDAGLDAGLELPYTCRGGICG